MITYEKKFGIEGFDIEGIMENVSSGSSSTDDILGSLAGPLNMAGMAIGIPGIGSLLSQVGNFAGFISGGTGAAGVDLHNERNFGHTHFYGAKLTCKWRDLQVIFNHLGTDLESYGWRTNQTPRSAQGIFKKAEDFLFENLHRYMDDVMDGNAQLPKSFDDDQILKSYIVQQSSAIQQVISGSSFGSLTGQDSSNTSNTGTSQGFDIQKFITSPIGIGAIVAGIFLIMKK
jgi:hypothetical protein